MDGNILTMRDVTIGDRHIIIRLISGLGIYWYTGYVELLPSDLKHLNNSENEEDLEMSGVFDAFPGGVTYYGEMPTKNNENTNMICAGFDTAHPYTNRLNYQDCFEALKITVNRLDKLS